MPLYLKLVLLFIFTLFLKSSDGKSVSNINKEIAFQSQNDTTSIINLLLETDSYLDRGEFETAQRKIDSALTMSKAINFDYGVIYARQSFADLLLKQQLSDSALIVLNKTLKEFSQSRIHHLLYNLTGVAYNYVGKVDTAIINYKKALELVSLLPTDKQEKPRISILLNMASSYYKLGDKSNTLKNYLEALKSAEVLDDNTLLSITLNNLGDTYNSYNEFDTAIYYLNRALEISIVHNLATNELRIYNNLGNAYANKSEYDTAIDYYKKGLELHKKIRPNTPPFQIIFNLGVLYTDQMRFDDAKAAFEESLKYCIDLNIYQGIYFNYEGLGNLNAAFKNYEEATKWYKKAFKVAKDLNQSFYIVQLKEKMYNNYKAAGDYRNALLELERFKAISDSISKKDSENALSELESKIELDRQTEINRLLEEKQIQQEEQLVLRQWLIITAVVVIILILLFLVFSQKVNKKHKRLYKEISKQKFELETINATKDKLFSIVSHDLRSPLASMQGILFLIKETDIPTSEIRKLAKRLEPTIQRNVDTMDDLLSWARLQMQGIVIDLNKTDITPILNEVIDKQAFQSDAKEIRVINKIESPLEVQIDINAFKLVFRNLLANSIKFTKNKGEITFTAIEKEHSILFSINDTGIGIPANEQAFIFSDHIQFRPGTNSEKGHGFGLNLCKEFVELMNGTITFESKEGHGTTFFVELPK